MKSIHAKEKPHINKNFHYDNYEIDLQCFLNYINLSKKAYKADNAVKQTKLLVINLKKERRI